MGTFNWRDEENLPELPLTRSEKLSKKLRETPLATWRIIRWAFCTMDVILIALILFIPTLERTIEATAPVRTLGETRYLTSTRTEMAYPGLFIAILLIFIISSILFLYFDSKIWICTNCHVWMSNPFRQRRFALFYIGLCPNCETSIDSMITGEFHTAKNVDQIREEHNARILRNGGWSCCCGKINPSHTGTCSCGQSKNASR